MTICDLGTGMLPYNSAKQQVLEQITPCTTSETLPLSQAHGRVLAHDIVSPMHVPPHDNSAMDGYALGPTSNSLVPLEYTVVETVLAGQTPQKQLNSGECTRIMTGALLPQNTYAVVMQEQVERNADIIRIANLPRAGSNIRQRGEDIAKDKVIVSKGCALSAVNIGVLASIGIATVEVFRPIKVALLTTGDELQEVGQSLQEGQIYDTNSYVLHSALQKLNCEVLNYGIIKDDLDVITETLTEAMTQADIIISSGGVSVGDADFVKTALAQLGDVAFWKVAMKPGKPFAFGKLADTVFFGLPGNPVSSVVTFQQLVIPAIETMQGQTPQSLPTFWAITKERIRKRPGRQDFQRAVYHTDHNGQLMVRALSAQGSGMLTSIQKANCLALLDAPQEDVLPGEKIQISLFHPALQPSS